MKHALSSVRHNRPRLGLLLVAALALAALLGAAPANAHDRYQLVYFDGHMHTVESDGSGTVDDVKTAALKNGVSAVIVTNHTKQITLDEWKYLNDKARALSRGNFLMLPAFEVTGSEGLLLRDHVLAWGVDDPFVGRDANELAPEEVWESPANQLGTGPLHPENIAKWVRYIHSCGGVAVHAHTSGSTDPAYGVDYIELFNLSHVKSVAATAASMGLPAAQAWGLGLTINNMAIYGERDLSMQVTLPLPGGASFTGSLRDALRLATGVVLGAPEAPLHSWDELLMAYVKGELNHPTFGVANSDAHNTANLAGSADYSDVGEVKNGVLVTKLTPAGLMSAIKAGRCFATTGPSLSFTVNGEDMGGTVRVKVRGSRAVQLGLSTASESPTAVVAKITIIKNGDELETLTPMASTCRTSLGDVVNQDGYYRMEVVSFDMTTGEYQFAYSNPVFVDVCR